MTCYELYIIFCNGYVYHLKEMRVIYHFKPCLVETSIQMFQFDFFSIYCKSTKTAHAYKNKLYMCVAYPISRSNKIFFSSSKQCPRFEDYV